MKKIINLSDFGFNDPVGLPTRSLLNMEEKKKMTSIRESAKSYESPSTKNICELKSVNTEMDIREETFTTKDGENFTVNIITVDGEDYRIPNSVLKSLRDILEEKPDVTKFKVVKKGEGMQTSYTVVTLD